MQEVNELRKRVEGSLEELRMQIEAELLEMLKKCDFDEKRFQSLVGMMEKLDQALNALHILLILLQKHLQKHY